jgi:hypothetical protein
MVSFRLGLCAYGFIVILRLQVHRYVLGLWDDDTHFSLRLEHGSARCGQDQANSPTLRSEAQFLFGFLWLTAAR